MKNCLKCFQFINYFFYFFFCLLILHTRSVACQPSRVTRMSHFSWNTLSVWAVSLIIICKVSVCGAAAGCVVSPSSILVGVAYETREFTVRKIENFNEIMRYTFVKCCRTCRRQINKTTHSTRKQNEWNSAYEMIYMLIPVDILITVAQSTCLVWLTFF